MHTMAASWIIFASILALGVAVPQVADIFDCDGVASEHCTVNEVKVDPCRKTSHCIIKKGTNASMAVDFTPNFTTSKLKIALFGKNGAIELPYDGLETDNGCAYTSCPTESGKSQLLNYRIHIGKKLPKGEFTMRLKLWNEEDESQVCCFRTVVQLVKGKKKLLK